MERAYIKNVNHINQYLEDLAQGDETLRHLLICALSTPLTKYTHNLKTISHASWRWKKALQQQFNTRTKPWVYFEPNRSLSNKIITIREWLKTAIANNENWLKNCDLNGNPNKLIAIHSIDDALRIAAQERKPITHKEVSLKRDWCKHDEEEAGQIETAMLLPNGYRIVRLLSLAAMESEGKAVQHCFRHKSDSKSDKNYRHRLENESHRIGYFSLRSERNKPHVTMEVDLKKNRLLQAKGKQNQTPQKRYMPYVIDFAKTLKLKPARSLEETGILYQGGEYWDIFDLPDDFEVEGDYILSKESTYIAETSSLRPPIPKIIHGNLNVKNTSVSIEDLRHVTYVGGTITTHSEDFESIEELHQYLNTIDMHCSRLEWFGNR